MFNKVFLFIIASFHEPEYLDFIRLRKLQLKQYPISHYFLFDDLPPPDYRFDENDIYMQKPELGLKKANNHPHMNPYMIIKFLSGLNKINENDYDYIIRVNLSTFLNIPALFLKLQTMPKYNFAMAHLIYQYLPDWDIYNHTQLTLLSGTCIILSSDIIQKLKTIDLFAPILFEHNDDTVLSHIISNYKVNIYNEPMYFLEHAYLCSYTECMNYCFFRIKHVSNRSNDIIQWKHLLLNIDNIYTGDPKQPNSVFTFSQGRHRPRPAFGWP
jgi:hypothetical protein